MAQVVLDLRKKSVSKYLGSCTSFSIGFQVFRSQSGPLQHDQDAAQFFAKSPPPQFSSNNTYDLGALRNALPAPNVQQNAVADWAADFMTQQPFASQQRTASSTPPVTQAVHVPHPNRASHAHSVPTLKLNSYVF